jgi:hypothetical protein
MMARLILAALCAVLFASNADARPKHHHLHRSPPMNQSKTDLGIVNESQLLRFGIRHGSISFDSGAGSTAR